jgi:PAS domain-containing protein
MHARENARDAERILRRAASTQEREHLLAQLLFEVGDLSAVVVDTEGRVIAMSRGMRAQVGADVTGRKFEEVCPWSPARWRDAFDCAMSGQRFSCAEDEVRSETGAHYYRWKAHAWTDAEGRICGALAYGGDITPLIEARQEAAATDERLRVALSAGRGVVWEADLKLEKMTWFGDPTRIYGRAYSFEEFQSVFMRAFDDNHRAYIMRSFDRAMSGEIETFEHRLPTGEDGEVRWVQIHMRTIKGRSGKVRRVVGLAKDVTARKRDEERFLAAMSRAEEPWRAKRIKMMPAGA